MEDSSHASPVLESDDEEDLAASLERTLPFSSDCCIYRIPVRLSHKNPMAYSPRVISIGPIHWGRQDLKAMEEQKLLYLKSFLLRTRSANCSLEDYMRFVEGLEMKVRDHYDERFENINSSKFVKMVVMDTAFLLELLLRDHERLSERNDRILNKPWKVQDVRYDLMLLENQLPFFVLEEIFKWSKLELSTESMGASRRGLTVERISLIKLIHKFFRFKAYLGERGVSVESFLGRQNQSFKIKHFVDFFRKFHLPEVVTKPSQITTLRVPSVIELYEAGVKFKPGPKKSLLDIKFEGRTLEIPPLLIRQSTESFFLNLVAYEQCHLLECYVNDYLFVIDRLVDSVKAVELLARKGVIETKLVDHQEVVTSIDSLARGSVLRHGHFHFNELCDGLNQHLRNPWNKRLATIKHTRFSSPLNAFYKNTAGSGQLQDPADASFQWENISQSSCRSGMRSVFSDDIED